MQLLIGSFLTLFFLAIAFNCQAYGSGDGLSNAAFQRVIANGFVVVDPKSPIARSTVLILKVNSNGQYTGDDICTGTIVSPDLVITAAHCLVEGKGTKTYKPEQLLVEMALFYDGEGRLPRSSTVRLKGLRRHPNYQPQGSKNDIGILRLADPLVRGYAPATILPLSQMLKQDMPSVVAGYGATTLSGYPSTFRLRAKHCKITNLDTEPPASTFISLSSESSGGIGSGDSGGPAFTLIDGTYYYWGVASTSDEKDYDSWDYEKIHNFRPWLEQAAGELGSSLTFPQ